MLARQTQLDNLVNLIGPAITEVQLMMGKPHPWPLSSFSSPTKPNKKRRTLTNRCLDYRHMARSSR